jgi:5-formyltetrahydrofolate cyclo-ligase
MTKNEIRAQMKTFLAGLDPMNRHARSLNACHQLASTREFKSAQLIMLFISMKSEVETSALALTAWQEGKSIAAPRTDWAGKRMEPVEIRSLDTGLEETPQGIREPLAGSRVPIDMIDLIVIPGMAFDRRGYRVGKGVGFYDRFLSQTDFRGVRVGLCFQEQLLSTPIPVEEHDIPMDLIVTDREIIHCPGHKE